MVFKTTGKPSPSASRSTVAAEATSAPAGIKTPNLARSCLACASEISWMRRGGAPKTRGGGRCGRCRRPIKAATAIAQSASGKPRNATTAPPDRSKANASGIFSGKLPRRTTGLPLVLAAARAAAITQRQAEGSHRSERGKSTITQASATSPLRIAANAAVMRASSPQI